MTPDVSNNQCKECLCVTDACKSASLSTMLYLDNLSNDLDINMDVFTSALSTHLRLKTLPNPVLRQMWPRNIIPFNDDGLDEEITIRKLTKDSADVRHEWVITMTMRSFNNTNQLPTNAQFEKRREELNKRFSLLFETNAKMPWENLSPHLSQARLGLDQYGSINQSGANYFRDYKTGGVGPNAAQNGAWCLEPTSATGGVPRKATCPLPSNAQSLLWNTAQCQEGGISNPIRSLTVMCYDIIGNELPTTVCPSFTTYPITTTIPCPSTTPTTTDNIRLNVDPTNDFTTTPITVTEGQPLDIYWKFPSKSENIGGQLSLTIVLVKVSPSSSAPTTTKTYSHFLTVVPAFSETTTVTIPYGLDLSDGVTYFIKMSITQLPSITLPSATTPTTTTGPITIKPADRCGGTCPTHSTCNFATNTCECTLGYNMDITTNTCQLGCAGQCNTGSCVLAYDDWNNVMGSRCECPVGKQGQYCQLTECNDQNLLCSGNGSMWDTTTNSCGTTCTCFKPDIWSGAHCDECHLYQSSSPIQCHVEGTNEIKTKEKCPVDYCICNMGWMGRDCSSRAMYGVVYFTTDTLPTGMLTFDPKMVHNNGLSHHHSKFNLKFLTAEAIAAIERDGAFTLGLDVDQVELIALVPSAKNPETYINPNYVAVVEEDPTSSPSSPSTTIYISAVFAVAMGSQPTTTTTTPTTNEPSGSSSTTRRLSSLSSLSIFTPQQTRFDIGSNSDFTNIGQLYSNWDSLNKGGVAQTPLGVSETQQELGNVGGVTPAFDPTCKPSETITCPSGADPFNIESGFLVPANQEEPKKKNVGLIVGVVIGVLAAVVIGFVILILAVRHCRKHQKACFKPKESRKLKSTKGTTTSVTAQSGSATASVAMSEMTRADECDFGGPAGSKTGNTATAPSATTGMEIIQDGEELPEGWTKNRNTATGQVFYVNTEQMISQKNSPLSPAGEDGGDDLGW